MILAYRYPRLQGRAEISKFLLARFARIWPAYVTALVFVLFILPTFPGYVLAETPLTGSDHLSILTHLVVNLAMIQSWMPLDWFSFSFNGPSWSISTEFALYLLFPFLIRNFERTWHWKLALALSLAVILIAVCVIFSIGWPTVQNQGINDFNVLCTFPLARSAGMTASASGDGRERRSK
jgi:peptidoglycan/LPS O-acetylase OafA/YrhL